MIKSNSFIVLIKNKLKCTKFNFIYCFINNLDFNIFYTDIKFLCILHIRSILFNFKSPSYFSVELRKINYSQMFELIYVYL